MMVLSLAIAMLPAGMVGGTAGACDSSSGWVIAEPAAGSETFLVGPAGETPRLPVSAALPTAVQTWHELRTLFERPRWDVEATTDEQGYSFNVARTGGPTVIEATFTRRIELAASSVSPSGNFTLFVQANNLATEVSVLDAQRSEQWTVELPHKATLAAFAITIHFDAAEECLVISEQRANEDGPEAWYVDLDTRQVSDPIPGFVVAWFG